MKIPAPNARILAQVPLQFAASPRPPPLPATAADARARASPSSSAEPGSARPRCSGFSARPARGEPVFRGAPAMREIYRGLLAFVSPRMDEGKPRGTALLERLEVPRADAASLTADLRGCLEGLLAPAAVGFPGSAERLERVLEVSVRPGTPSPRARTSRRSTR